MLNRVFSSFLVTSPVRWTGLVLLLLFPLSGCYSYVPVLGDGLAPGDDVRLRLSAPTATTVSERVGRPIRSVEGPLLAFTSDSLQVDVGWGAIYAGTVFEGRRDTLQFHRSQVLEVDRREFSRVRTGLTAVALTTGAVALIRMITGGGQSQGPPDPGPPPPVMSIPFGR